VLYKEAYEKLTLQSVVLSNMCAYLCARFANKPIIYDRSISYKTKSANNQTVERKWHVIDADGLIVGRMCTKVASILRGKHKPSYTPHVDTGDYVIVLNADKLRLTGNKVNHKVYLRYSGYPGGQKSRTVREQMEKDSRIVN